MQRLLILGLDGATLDLVNPWVDQGLLPNFASLIHEGASGRLRSVPNMNTAPAWTTFMTGKNPGKHGVFWFAEEGEGAGTVRFVNAADRKAVSLWRLLSQSGRRVVAMNVPLTFPAEPVNGAMVAGFDAPSTSSRGFSYPPELIERLQKACGPYLLHAPVAQHAAKGNFQALVKEALDVEETRVRAALHLMGQQPWDVFMYMIKATDQVGHYAWEYGVSNQRWMQYVYQYADEVLGRFRKSAGPDCGVIVMSDHGMGWRQPAAEYLSDILIGLGYLTRSSRSDEAATWHAFKLAKRLGSRAKGKLKRALPGAYRRFAYKVRFGGIDWTRTRAYSDNTRSCIWVNLQGRNPQGVVSAEDYPALIADLKEMLLDLRDPATGEPVVNAAWTPQDVYWGPHTNRAPDIQIDWRYDRPVSGLSYRGRLGEASSDTPNRGFMNSLTGAHRPDGLLLMHGPQVAHCQIEAAGLEDMAPTVLHLCKVPVPDDMDGRVLAEALEPGYSQLEVRTRTPSGAEPVLHAVYSEEESEELEERLRSLGYL